MSTDRKNQNYENSIIVTVSGHHIWTNLGHRGLAHSVSESTSSGIRRIEYKKSAIYPGGVCTSHRGVHSGRAPRRITRLTALSLKAIVVEVSLGLVRIPHSRDSLPVLLGRRVERYAV